MVWVVPEKELYLYVEGYFQMGLRVKTGGCSLQELPIKGVAHQHGGVVGGQGHGHSCSPARGLQSPSTLCLPQMRFNSV